MKQLFALLLVTGLAHGQDYLPPCDNQYQIGGQLEFGQQMPYQPPPEFQYQLDFPAPPQPEPLFQPPATIEYQLRQSAPRLQFPPPQLQPCTRTPAPRPIPLGAVLVSRNTDERQNRSPGYWNHLAIYVGNGQLVESMDGVGVRLVTYQDFMSRNYSAVWVLFPRNPEQGQMAAYRARSLVGMPYARASSFLPILQRRGMNCISVINESYAPGQRWPRMRIPDDAFNATNIFATTVP